VSQSILDAASLAALEGNVERAAILTGAARRIEDESGGLAPPELVNRIEAMPTLERELPAVKLAELLAQGARLSNDEATELALSD
jgi:hypothetical protein